MASPPESSRARLLKLRRVHVEFVRRNRDREMRWLLPGKSDTATSGAFLVIGRRFRLCPGQRFRCDFDRHSTRSDQPRTACIRLQTEVLVQAHYFWGRTGFDSSLEAQTACRGWFVGLVKNRTKTNKRRLPRSRSRGLIDRDVWSWTPATAPNVDSRLIKRRSDRAGW